MSKEIISKELLREVLGRKTITDIAGDGWGKDDEIAYWFQDRVFCINIYELAHKCKEWAYAKGYSISSAYGFGDDEMSFSYASLDKIGVGLDTGSIENIDVFHSMATRDEPEAIFKACQWILDNK